MELPELHPMATGHIPIYVAAADGSDYLFNIMIVFTVIVIILIGVSYFTLHSVPERMAHKSNHSQFQLVGILALLALFTHNGIFWIAAILVAGFQLPDFGGPLRAIADAIDRNGSPRSPEVAASAPRADVASPEPVQPPVPADPKVGH
ncbi:MAG: hypothetical protein AAF501_07355 [Pseudomonadota bacterium]